MISSKEKNKIIDVRILRIKKYCYTYKLIFSDNVFLHNRI